MNEIWRSWDQAIEVRGELNQSETRPQYTARPLIIVNNIQEKNKQRNF